MRKYAALATVLTLAAALLLGCASYSTPAATTTTTLPPLAGNLVSISNYAYSPAALTVTAGTTVTWTNNDSVAHTVTSDTGYFGSRQMSPGGTCSFTFTSPGTYGYHCQIHPTMKGTIIVIPGY